MFSEMFAIVFIGMCFASFLHACFYFYFYVFLHVNWHVFCFIFSCMFFTCFRFAYFFYNCWVSVSRIILSELLDVSAVCCDVKDGGTTICNHKNKNKKYPLQNICITISIASINYYQFILKHTLCQCFITKLHSKIHYKMH